MLQRSVARLTRSGSDWLLCALEAMQVCCLRGWYDTEDTGEQPTVKKYKVLTQCQLVIAIDTFRSKFGR